MPTRVAFVRRSDYTPALGDSVERLFSHLGGAGAFFRPGQRVLLKPNMLMDTPPERAVTTHPEVVRALVRLARRQGAVPTVADSPANAVQLRAVWERTGFRAMCDEEGVPLVSLEKAGSTVMSANGISFSIAKPVLEADLVVTIPKVKTHVLTVLTGAVKNMYGAVPGVQKTHLHKRYPRPREFGRMIAAVYGAIRPGLAVADGIVGMAGNGPSGGKSVPLGFLAASADPVALDVALCCRLGIDERRVAYLGELRDAGLGETRRENIEMAGEIPPDLPGGTFPVPSNFAFRLIPSVLARAASPWAWIRPLPGDRCVRCGQCVRACPTAALDLGAHGPPVLAPARCIGCCCCHEVCPAQAIEMVQSPFLNLLQQMRDRRRRFRDSSSS